MATWRMLVGAALLQASCALAQVAESGRWQDLDYRAADVDLQFGYRYQDLLHDTALDGRLDEDPAFLRRLQAVLARLAAAAARTVPQSAAIPWEVHATDDPGADALSMAGGKLLVGSRWVGRLGLDDDELAVLLGHEMAHVLAEHSREMISGVHRLRLLPHSTLPVLIELLESDLSVQLRMARLGALQEAEADQLGMTLAYRAGSSPEAIVAFYDKLLADETGSAVLSTHPSASSRLSMARAMQRLLPAQERGNLFALRY